MEINMPQNGQGGITSRGGTIPQGATVISPHLKKQSVAIDKDGNFIDLATKQIIEKINPND